jgi:hypothetical protein
VVQDTTGIVLKPDGDASDSKTIEMVNTIEVANGVAAQFCNNDKVMLEKRQVGYDQSAVFRPSKKIYFGLASSLQSAVISSKKFFELDLTRLSYVMISLNRNAESGYQFQIEEGS